jgi:hypothetical protein
MFSVYWFCDDHHHHRKLLIPPFFGNFCNTLIDVKKNILGRSADILVRHWRAGMLALPNHFLMIYITPSSRRFTGDWPFAASQPPGG